MSKTREWLAIAALLGMIPAAQSAIDIYAPSMLSIARDFNTSYRYIQFTVTLYLVGLGVFKLLWGPVADCIGARRCCLAGTFIFAVSCLLTDDTNLFSVLCLCRLGQAFGAAALSTLNKSLMVDLFGGKKLERLMSVTTAIWALAPIMAPALGGFLECHYGWPASFLVMAAYSFFLFMAIFLFIPETPRSGNLNFSAVRDHFLVVARHNGFWHAVACLGGINAILLSFNFFCPYFIIQELGYSPEFFGQISLFMGCAYLVGCLANAALLKYYRRDDLSRIALMLICLVAAVALLLTHAIPRSLTLLLIMSSTISALAGLVFANVLVACIGYFKHVAGNASSLLGAGLSLISGAQLYATSQLYLKSARPLALGFLVIGVFCLIMFNSMTALFKLKQEPKDQAA